MKINKRRFLKLGGAALGSMALTGPLAAVPAAKRNNRFGRVYGIEELR